MSLILLHQLKLLFTLTLLILLPWHSLIIDGYLKDYLPNINFWKDGVVLLLLVLVVFSVKKLKSNTKILILFSVVLIFLYSFYLLASLSIQSMVGFRYAVIGLLAFLIGLLSNFSKKDLRLIFLFIAINTLFIFVFALVQAFIIGSSFLLDAGYPAGMDGRPLKYSFYFGGGELQRLSGGFAGPIAYGFYMFFIFTLAMSTEYRSKFVAFIAAIGVLFSFSRAFIAGMFLFYLLLNKKSILKKAVLVLSLLLLLLFFIYLGFLYKISVFELIWGHLVSTVNFTDSSTLGHYESYVQTFKLLSQNWFLGLGLGNVGSHTMENGGVVPESTWLSIWLEAGFIIFIGGVLLYVLVFLRAKQGFLGKFLITLIPIMFLLPLQSYTEVTIIIAFFIGAHLQAHDSKYEV